MDFLLFILGVLVVAFIFLYIQKKDAIEDGEKPIIDVIKENVDVVVNKAKEIIKKDGE